jgi:hypothetical protein
MQERNMSGRKKIVLDVMAIPEPRNFRRIVKSLIPEE